MDKKGILIAIVGVLLVIGLLGSCNSSSSSSNYSGYSDTYKNNAQYRDNVSDIADAFGVSKSEVDRKINAVTGGR